MKKLKIETETNSIRFPSTMEDCIKLFTSLRDDGWEISYVEVDEGAEYIVVNKTREETDEEYNERIDRLRKKKEKERQNLENMKKAILKRELKEYERLKKKFEELI